MVQAVFTSTIPLVARWLKVEAPAHPRQRPPLEWVPSSQLKGNLVEFTVAAEATTVGRQVIDLGLPKGALIVLMGRSGTYLVPDGSTVLEGGDQVLVIAATALLPRVRDAIGASGVAGS